MDFSPPPRASTIYSAPLPSHHRVTASSPPPFARSPTHKHYASSAQSLPSPSRARSPSSRKRIIIDIPANTNCSRTHTCSRPHTCHSPSSPARRTVPTSGSCRRAAAARRSWPGAGRWLWRRAGSSSTSGSRTRPARRPRARGCCAAGRRRSRPRAACRRRRPLACSPRRGCWCCCGSRRR